MTVKQGNLWPSDTQGPMSNSPLNPTRYLSDPFDIANETKTKEVHFSAYPKPSLISKNHRTSELSGRENEERLNCDNATSSYNQVYAELIQNRKASFNSHCGLKPDEHE